MVANPEKYTRASDGTGTAVRAVVASKREPNDLYLNVDSVAHWPNKFIATAGTLDEDTGMLDPDTFTEFYGHLEGSIIVIEEFCPGYSDYGNEPYDIVVIKPATPWADAISLAANNTVLTTGDQTIDGNKTFTDTLDIQNDAGAELRLSSQKKATLVIEADTDNVDEADVASINLIQDGGLVTGSVGFGVGSQENDLVIRNDYASGDIHLDAGGDIYSNGKNLVDMFYPVGSTYFNKTNSTNPATLLGFGTWVRLQGVVLGGRSETGGSPFNVAGGTVIGADTHTLTKSELPSYTLSTLYRVTIQSGSGQTNILTTNSTSYTTPITSGGSDSAHNNIQRTLVGYLWERTA